MPLVVAPIAVFATAVLLVSAVSSAAAGGTSTNAARNAGITWVSDTVIRDANVDGSGRRVLAGRFADDAGDPCWTRDGRALAFFASYSDTSRIYVFSPNTHRIRALGSGGSRSSEPTWSPDAKRVAFSEAWGSFEVEGPATIKVVSLATKRETPVTKPSPNQSDVDPAWSPDGKSVAFARRRGSGTPTIYLVRPDGRSLRRLTLGHSPSWSPDGTRIAFVLGHSIYAIRADGHGRERIVDGLREPLFSWLPDVVRWSPDGAKLLYSSGADAWIANTDGTHRTRFVRTRWGLAGIAWRPG